MALAIALLLAVPLLAPRLSFASAHAPVAAQMPVETRACPTDGAANQGPAEEIKHRDRHRSGSHTSPLLRPRGTSPKSDPDTAPADRAPSASYARPDRSVRDLSAPSLQVFRC
ncbi:hypothetical protein ABZY90_26190 [Streptomyces sp. NPDC006422]|uniref:hypothetical protein n=1 Tax=unclassified Streptomyces TaxID=2593676 RepID=UPI0033A7081D